MNWIGILSFFICLSSWASQGAPSFGFVDMPKGCLGAKAYPCQVRVTGGSLQIERQSSSGQSQSFSIADRGGVSFLSADEIQVLNGTVWVRRSHKLLVRMSSVLQMEISGQWFFEKQIDGSHLVRNLAGVVQFRSQRVFENEALPMGFQNWFGLVDSTGQVSRGVIRPIDLSPFLRTWLPVSGMSVAEMKKHVQGYRDLWKDGLEMSAQFYEQIAARRLASAEEREQKRLQRQNNFKNERLKLNQMYRNRNGLTGPDGL